MNKAYESWKISDVRRIKGKFGYNRMVRQRCSKKADLRLKRNARKPEISAMLNYTQEHMW